MGGQTHPDYYIVVAGADWSGKGSVRKTEQAIDKIWKFGVVIPEDLALDCVVRDIARGLLLI